MTTAPGTRAAALHRDALVWDNHGCMPLESAALLAQYLPQLTRYRDAGTDVVMINVGYGEMPLGETLERLAHLRRYLRAHPEHYVEALSVADIERAKASGMLAVGFDLEGMAPIQDELALISTFYDLGVRWMLIAYNRTNRIGGGCHDADPGLTDLGREALDEMARVGMVCCCSHTGYRTALDVMRYSKNPVILSHSNPRALKDHPRNVPDEILDACARTGGVIGINGIGIFLGDNEIASEVFVRHVDYVAQAGRRRARRHRHGLRVRPGRARRRPAEVQAHLSRRLGLRAGDPLQAARGAARGHRGPARARVLGGRRASDSRRQLGPSSERRMEVKLSETRRGAARLLPLTVKP